MVFPAWSTLCVCVCVCVGGGGGGGEVRCCVVWADSHEYTGHSTVHTFHAIHHLLTVPV